jgi:hypothetical protein
MALLSCSEEGPKAWTPKEMKHLVKQFGHIAEAFAVADLCMPVIDSDREAERELTSKIGIPHYTQLLSMDTEAELERFWVYHHGQGGSAEQHAKLKKVYQDAYQAAVPHLGALDTCVETVSDFANTILHTRAPDTH